MRARLPALALLLAAATARAQAGDLEHARARKAAEDLERAGDYAGCGGAYLALYERWADDEVALYNSAICFQHAGDVDRACAALEALVQRHPRSWLAPRALAALGSTYEAVARFELAAGRYEQLARLYAGEHEARDGLLVAVHLRAGLGQLDRAQEDAARFARNYGARSPRDTARAFLTLAIAHEGDRDHERLLEAYLRVHARAGGVYPQVVAHARLGESLWRRSCRAATADGLCARELPPPRRPAGCDTPAVRLEASRRDRGLATRAQQHFAAAVRLWAQAGAGSRSPAREEQLEAAAAAPWAAAAAFRQVEPAVEQVLAVPLPRRLELGAASDARRRAAAARLRGWLDHTRRALQDAEALLAALVRADSAEWALAAIARTGRLYEHLAASIAAVPLPAPLATPELRQVYCDALEDASQPLIDRAIEAYEVCLERAHALDLPGRTATLCAARLTALAPADHPPVREVHGGPDAPGRPTARAPLVHRAKPP